MHGRKARRFFEKGMEYVRREKDPELMAYMLGFGCHYILDSTCHPYVNQVAKEGKVSHTLLEKELDRMLMYETGKILSGFILLMALKRNIWRQERSIRCCRRSGLLISYLSLKMIENLYQPSCM